MLPENYIKVLNILCEKLAGLNINWTLTGSTSFIIQGMLFTPNDIDMQTDEIGAYEIEKIFEKYVKRKVEYSPTDKICSHFGELEINGIKVEIMGDIQKCINGQWEESVDINKHKKILKYQGMEIPVMDLKYESKAYEKMGRTEKAKLLEEWSDKR